jgi:hypothetical protein
MGRRARPREGPKKRLSGPAANGTAEVESNLKPSISTIPAQRRQWRRPRAKAIRIARDFMSPSRRTP